MNVRKTRAGWVVEITHERGGCLEQGGICGREELYTRETLQRLGIDYDADPHADAPGCSWATNLQYLRNAVECDHVLRRGEQIR
jgi:hypothetical protein